MPRVVHAAADEETDPDRKQVLAVVERLELPCDEADLAPLVTNMDAQTLRQVLGELSQDRLVVDTDSTGRLAVRALR